MHMEGREGSRVILGCEGSVGGGNGTVEMKDSPSSTPSPSPPPPPLGERVVADMGGVGPPPPPVATGMMMGFGMGMTGSGGGGGGGSSGEDLARKKRGRPRKYGPDGGNMEERGGGMALALIPTSPFSPNSSAAGAKRGRGRPPGSGRRQLLAALGEWFAYSAGGNFTPHVVTIAAGEDVAAKILSFSQKGPRAVCILSANGAISNVTLRQPGSSGGTLTYEGRFEILSLSGSFTITDNGGIRCRTGGISVSLAGPDGRVVGGGVAGLLLAASPIQVVVGSFLPNTYKEHKRRSNLDSSSFSPVPTTSALPTAARPISQANPGEECETPTSALPSQNHGDAENNMSNNSNPTTNLNSSSFRIAGWPGLQHSSPEHKPSPDINICPHGE